MAKSEKADALMQSFGSRLKEAREIAGYNDAATLAREVGLGEQAYRKYERGESIPRLDKLQDICLLLGQTLDWLLLGRVLRIAVEV